MKINSENAKRQRAIARRMKSGKPLVGLLAGLAVGAVMTGCDSSERDGMYTAGKPLPPAETNAVNEAGEEVTDGLIIDGDIGEAEVPES